MLRMVLYYQGGDHVLQEKFGEFLIEQRKKRNLTQKEIAKKIGVSTAAVSKWERGCVYRRFQNLKILQRFLI